MSSEDWEEFINMDKGSLLNLLIERDKRIHDLEKLVEDQKRLRLQDSNQVEEKAAKIKEWVTNKLKELENQNRQLRDQNKKQKEAVDSLTHKLATLSPISSPRRRNGSLGKSSISEHISPIDTIDVDKSLQCRRPQLKKSLTSVSSSSEDENKNLKSRFVPSTGKPNHDRVTHCKQDVTDISCDSTGRSIISISSSKPISVNNLSRQDSPLYDSVNMEHIINHEASTRVGLHNQNSALYDESPSEVPPPPPPHQSNKWELELYSLADQSISTLKHPHSNDQKYAEQLVDESSTNYNSTMSRKSSTSSRNELISLVHPAFTTIDGDQVVEDFQFGDRNTESSHIPNGKSRTKSFDRNEDQSSQTSSGFSRTRQDSLDSQKINGLSLAQNLFDSPMRSRSGKDNLLRTQSVKKSPAPEKLYDFITTDLVKRGYLIKSGALKNHNRWFVLKNFHLHSFKRELDETTKAQPLMSVKLEPSAQVYAMPQSNDSSFPFKISYQDKTLHLIAETARSRDEWMRIITVTINMSDVEPDDLRKNDSTYEGLVSVTRHGHSKRCHAVLVGHIVFFLKSFSDPSPMSYLSIKEAKIREIIDNHDYDLSEKGLAVKNHAIQDCSLAVYPKYSIDLDPLYMSLGNQQETDAWLYYLSNASRIDQSYGTQFERALAKTMINQSMLDRKHSSGSASENDNSNGCQWREQSVMLYSDRPITQPLTSLPNETLQKEAVEMFKSVLLFTQVPLEPIAIDYHVCLLQNCLGRFLKYPELRNEFYAQLIKQCTYVIHRCPSPKLSSSSSGCSSLNPRYSANSLSPASSECQFVTDIHLLDCLSNDKGLRMDPNSTLSQLNSLRDKRDSGSEHSSPPSQSELLQVMQILAVATSLNLPRGRIRWRLINHLRKFANPNTSIGKYALYTLRAIDRTTSNGTRDFVPSRMEIMSILLRNPYDHSKPHSLPVSFTDGSYLVVEADGSTTVEEFMTSMSRRIDVRHSLMSDFYLFADDPSGLNDLHILEPQRKILDVVGWWEQAFRQNNSGRYQNTKAIKLACKKRLLLKAEPIETDQERLLIVHQVNQEIISHRIPLNETLTLELASIMAQLTFGDFDESKEPKLVSCILDKIKSSFLPPNKSSHGKEASNQFDSQLVERWMQISGRSAQDCVRVYLNCIRRLKLGD